MGVLGGTVGCGGGGVAGLGAGEGRGSDQGRASLAGVDIVDHLEDGVER